MPGINTSLALYWVLTALALCAFTAGAQQVQVLPGGPWTVWQGPSPIRYEWPDGHITLLNDGSGPQQLYYCESESYRALGYGLFNQGVSINPTHSLEAPGANGTPDSTGDWFMGVFRASGNNLIAFVHQEDHWWHGTNHPEGWLSIGLSISSDDGAGWTKTNIILSEPKPSKPQWGGIGNNCAVWSESDSNYHMFYPVYNAAGGADGIGSAISSGSSVTNWSQYFNGSFSTPGNGGANSPLPGLGSQINDYANPSVIYDTYLNEWLMVMGDFRYGVFYISQSSDLVNWSTPQVLLNNPGYEIEYPTLIGQTDQVGGKYLVLAYAAGTNNLSFRQCLYQVVQLNGGTGEMVPDGQWHLYNQNSWQCAIDEAGSTLPGKPIDQWPLNGTDPTEAWTLANQGGDYVIITNLFSGLVMDVSGSSVSSGAQIIQNTPNGSASQRWKIVDAGGWFYWLENQNSGLYLDVQGASTSNGAHLVQTSFTGASSQWWRIGL